MTDEELVRKKLAGIEGHLADLRGRADASRLESDIEHQRFVLYTLQVAIQGMLDVAAHIVSDERLGEPDTNRELLSLLARHGWVAQELVPALQAMTGFRNRLVHLYAAIDLARVREVLAHHLDDLAAFVTQIRARLAG